jgi:hypothetical protein
MKSKTTQQHKNPRRRRRRMPRFQFPKAETTTKHLQPLILPHNKTSIKTHTHTKRSSNKILQMEDSNCADLGYRPNPIVGFGSVWPALYCLKFIFFRKDLLIFPYTSLDYSSSSFMMLLCLHATDEWVFCASLYLATFVLTSYLRTPKKKPSADDSKNSIFLSLSLSFPATPSTPPPPAPL